MLKRLTSMFRGRRRMTGEVAGSSIRDMLAPYIGELPLNPDAPARDAQHGLEQASQLQIYRQTLRDERCAAALDQRLNAAISTPWEVEPGGDADVDRQAAEDLSEQLGALDFPRISRQLLHGVWYGWAVGEAIWERDGGRVRLADLAIRSPDRFWWSVDGRLLLRTYNHPEGEPVPDRKFVVLARPGEHNDLPWAPGLARWCYWPVWMKRHGMQFWSVALERFGTPIMIGKFHPRASDPEQRKFLAIVQSIAAGTGGVIREDQVIEPLQSSSRTGDSFEQFCRYCDQLVTTTILGQSSTTDQGPWRGTAEVQRTIRDETVAADARLLDGALNTTVATWLTEWNHPGAATPMIRHDADPADDLDARAKREQIISQTTGWRPTMEHVTDVFGGEWEERPTTENAPPGDGDQEDDDAGLADPPFPVPAGITTHWPRRRRTTVRSLN